MTIPRVSNATQRDAPDSDRGNLYAIVARSIIGDPNLSDAAFRLYVLLDSRATGRSVRVKNATLAADLNRSEKSISRAMTELVRAGYVIRKRTRSVSVTAVENPIRKQSKPSTVQTDLSAPDSSISPDLSAPDGTDVSGTSRSTSIRNKTNNQRNNYFPDSRVKAKRDPLPIGATTAANPLYSAYVDAIAQATGLPLKATKTVVRKIEKIASKGMTPAEAGEAARAEMLLASGMRNVQSPVGWLAGVALDALSDPYLVPTELDASQRAQQIVRALLSAESTDKPLQTVSTAAGDPLTDTKGWETSIDPETSQRGIAACRAALITERTDK